MGENSKGNGREYRGAAMPMPGIPGKPCRACTDFKSWMTANPNPTRKITSSANSQAHECPLDKDELGRHTWSFLHTMAAYYPKKPSETQQKDMNCLIHKFSKFYPCDFCAADMREDLKVMPPRTANQQELSQWFCRLHNKVNEKLGKSVFDCSRVNERWRDGWKDGSCD